MRTWPVFAGTVTFSDSFNCCPEMKQKLTDALEKCKKLERKGNTLLLKSVTRDSLVNDDNKVKY